MKYVLGIVAIIFVMLIGILLLTGGGDEPRSDERVILAEEANKPGASVAFTTQGRLVGQNERRAIRVKISQDERRLEILTGYEEAADRSHVYPNTDAAYETFLVALDQAGFTDEQKTVVEDERGACPLGKRYIYEFKEYSQQIVHLWDTSCGNRAGGTFDGDDSTIRKLFERQIPDYRDRVRDVDL